MFNQEQTTTGDPLDEFLRSKGYQVGPQKDPLDDFLDGKGYGLKQEAQPDPLDEFLKWKGIGIAGDEPKEKPPLRLYPPQVEGADFEARTRLPEIMRPARPSDKIVPLSEQGEPIQAKRDRIKNILASIAMPEGQAILARPFIEGLVKGGANLIGILPFSEKWIPGLKEAKEFDAALLAEQITGKQGLADEIRTQEKSLYGDKIPRALEDTGNLTAMLPFYGTVLGGTAKAVQGVSRIPMIRAFARGLAGGAAVSMTVPEPTTGNVIEDVKKRLQSIPPNVAFFSLMEVGSLTAAKVAEILKYKVDVKTVNSVIDKMKSNSEAAKSNQPLPFKLSAQEEGIGRAVINEIVKDPILLGARIRIEEFAPPPEFKPTIRDLFKSEPVEHKPQWTPPWPKEVPPGPAQLRTSRMEHVASPLAGGRPSPTPDFLVNQEGVVVPARQPYPAIAGTDIPPKGSEVPAEFLPKGRIRTQETPAVLVDVTPKPGGGWTYNFRITPENIAPIKGEPRRLPPGETPPTDVELASRPISDIMKLPAGPERDAAITARMNAGYRLVKSLKPGDIIDYGHGDRAIVVDVSHGKGNNGLVTLKPENPTPGGPKGYLAQQPFDEIIADFVSGTHAGTQIDRPVAKIIRFPGETPPVAVAPEVPARPMPIVGEERKPYGKEPDIEYLETEGVPTSHAGQAEFSAEADKRKKIYDYFVYNTSKRTMERIPQNLDAHVVQPKPGEIKIQRNMLKGTLTLLDKGERAFWEGSLDPLQKMIEKISPIKGPKTGEGGPIPAPAPPPPGSPRQGGALSYTQGKPGVVSAQDTYEFNRKNVDEESAVELIGDKDDKITITPSAKQPGKWQATLFVPDEKGELVPAGDRQYDTWEDAVKGSSGVPIQGKTAVPGGTQYRVSERPRAVEEPRRDYGAKFDPEQLPEIYKKIGLPRENEKGDSLWGEMTEYVMENYDPAKDKEGIEHYIKKKLFWKGVGKPPLKPTKWFSKPAKKPTIPGLVESELLAEKEKELEPSAEEQLEHKETWRKQDALIKGEIRKAVVGDKKAARNEKMVFEYIMADDPPSYDEIGEKYGITNVAARKVILETYAKLRENPEVKKLLEERKLKYRYAGIPFDKKNIQDVIDIFKERFTSKAGLPEDVDAANDRRFNNIMADKFESGHLAKTLRKFINNGEGEPGAKADVIANILFEGYPYESYAFPEEIKDTLKKARASIDKLSAMIATQVDLPPELAAIINREMGRYYHTSYKLYEYQEQSQRKGPLRRRYWNPPEEKKQAWANLLKEKFPKTFGDFTKEQMDEYLNAELRGRPNRRLPKGTGSHSKQIITDALKKKDPDLSKAWKDFAGFIDPHEDPVWVYTKTIDEIVEAGNNAEFINSIAKEYEGDLWTADEDLANKWGWQKHSLPNQIRFGVLSGKYVHPILYEYFIGEGDKFSRSQLGRFADTFIMMPFKITKTLLSYPTHLRNAMSNVGFSIFMRGSILNPANWQYCYRTARAIAQSGGKRKDEWAKLIREGITDVQYFGNEVADFYSDLLRLDPMTWLEKILHFGLKGPIRVAGKIYNAEDTFFRIAAHYKNMEHFKMTPEESLFEIDNGMTNYRKLPWVVKGMRRYPIIGGPFISWMWNVGKIMGNQARIGSAELFGKEGGARGGSKGPGAGSYFSRMFPDDPDKAMRARGLQRLLTLLGVVSLPMVLREIWIHRLGIDEKDLNKLEKCYPDYRRNNTLLYWKDEKGKLCGTDLSYMWPTGNWEQAARAAVSRDWKGLANAFSVGVNPLHDFYSILFQGRDPRWGREIPGGVMGKVAEVLKEFYVPVSSPLPSIPGLIKDGKIQPGTFTGYQIKKIMDAYNGEDYTEEPTREVKNFLTGIRVFTIDPRKLIKARLNYLSSNRKKMGNEKYFKEKKEILELWDKISREWKW